MPCPLRVVSLFFKSYRIPVSVFVSCLCPCPCNLAYNNLSGKTPDMKAQFGTFSASHYEGNPFLCGPPLEKSCTSTKYSPPTPTQSSDVSDEKWRKVDQAVFFTSFLVTYIIFFLGVILYINPHWQLWCYNLFEDCMYSCYFFVAFTLSYLPVCIISYGCFLNIWQLIL